MLTIRGRGFQSGAPVTIGGKSAATNFVDINTLTVTTPSLTAGRQQIIITNPNGDSYTLDAAFAPNYCGPTQLPRFGVVLLIGARIRWAQRDAVDPPESPRLGQTGCSRAVSAISHLPKSKPGRPSVQYQHSQPQEGNRDDTPRNCSDEFRRSRGRGFGHRRLHF